MKIVVFLLFLLPLIFAVVAPFLGFNPVWVITLTIFSLFIIFTLLLGFPIIFSFVESFYHQTNATEKILVIIGSLIFFALLFYRLLTLPVSLQA